MIAFYEMPEFERIKDPYQPELADRSYNLTFCLSDYQEHSFDSCPGRGLAYSLGVLMILSCTTCMQNMLPWSNSMGRLHLSNSQCDWTRKSYEAHNCNLQVATQLCVEQEKKTVCIIQKGIWVGFLNIFTNFFLLRTARMSYEHWYKKVRFLQRANIFSAIATASFDAYCTILYIDYLKYANHAKENHSKIISYENPLCN